MKTFFYKIFLLLFLFLSIQLNANVRFTHLTIQDGLSQLSVKSLFQDSKGFIWAGTADGLNRYDGYEFNIYRNILEKENSVGGNDISCIYECVNGTHLFIGTQDAGLFLYNRDRDNFRSITSKIEHSRIHIKDILEDANGTIWIATLKDGLFRYSISDSVLYPVSFGGENQPAAINSLASDESGTLWLGCINGLFTMNQIAADHPAELQKINYTAATTSPAVRVLTFDVKGYLWIGTQNDGLFCIHPRSSYNKHYLAGDERNALKSNQINDIICDDDGIFWIATANGLYMFNQKNKEFEIFRNQKNNPESISANQIYCLLKDDSGILWAGTYAGGINKLDYHQYRFPIYHVLQTEDENTYSLQDIRSFQIDNQEHVWIGTSNGLYEISRNDLTTSPEIFSKVTWHNKNQYVGALGSIKNGIIVSSESFIEFIDHNGQRHNFTAKILAQTGVQITAFRHSVSDDQGCLWLATSLGLLKYNPAEDTFNLFKPPVPEDEKKTPNLSTLFFDHSGKLWVGTHNTFLYVFDIHKESFEPKLSDIKLNGGRRFSKIFSINETRPGNIWLGTDRGLFHLDDNSQELTKFNVEDGLPNNIVYAVVPENDRKVWCSTNLGITCFDTETKTFSNYSKDDGLQGFEFNEGAYLKDDKGFIYLGGTDGFNVFNPSNIITNNYLPKVVITEMEIQYKEVSPENFPDVVDKQISEVSSLKLHHKLNTFSFTFTALSYSLPQRNKYRFCLTEEGQEDKWIDAKLSRTATYTNVPPGNYLFKVMGSNADGVWNPDPTTIKITIVPPFWQTSLFRILVILLIGSGFYAFVYFRLKQIRNQQQKLKQLVREKTLELTEQAKQIERQNAELLRVNRKMAEKNKHLYDQHQQISEQRDKLLKMAETVEESNQARIRFFTSVSHELRTPLTLIISPLKAILNNFDKTSTGDLKRNLGNMYSNASKLLLIVNQLLDFRKAESEKLQLHVSHFNLVTFVRNTFLLFDDLAKQKNFSFSFNTPSDNIPIWADSDKLEKVIYNLLSNAFKFTDVGGKIVVGIFPASDGKSVTISIHDTGIGIEQDKLPFIFEQFYQLKTPHQINIAGSGLGLALVAKYMELHKGNVAVKSEPGEGTVFSVTLLTGKDHFDDNVAFEKETIDNSELLRSTIRHYIPMLEQETIQEQDKKHTVLLVEDDEDLRAFMKEILLRQFHVIEASNGVSGLQLTEERNPDVVVSDVMMPGMGGFELCNKIKSEFSTCHIPVILLTSLADQESHFTGIEVGADDFITKPFDNRHLVLSIQNLISGRKRLQNKYRLIDSNNMNSIVSGDADQVFIKEAIGFIEQHLSDSDFNVESLCNQLQMSQSQCYRKIKSITGFNISEFIRNTRLKKAAELLVTGEYKINEIAYETGFNDPNYFTRCFTRLFGVRPSEYGRTI
ncbi:hybrid sensor histidine kinase/response regulator transcription factor [Maribellus sediminis]|uniref:hybrid sensor histidine kinase/response regulator transcription factor n=1 Tax=Maribellus sediminis TaxID=2696285 RepID=UPI001430C513|nr:hybrid sensor histidine kinase/response regulator transcription factor [Maribellus sediminis]